MNMRAPEDALELLDTVVKRARKKGADEADAIWTAARGISATHRNGITETSESAEGERLGLRVIINKRQAIITTSDLSAEMLSDLTDQALTLARAVPDNPYCGLAAPGQLAGEVADLDLAPADVSSPAEIEARLSQLNALAPPHPDVLSLETEASAVRTASAIRGSNGLSCTRTRSRFSLSAGATVMEDMGKQRDSAFSSARHPDDLQNPADVTGRAISRARARLGATPPKGGRMPVVFSPRVARGLLGHLISAVNGQAVVRRSSFLADAMGEKIFPENITIVDDPLRRRGLRSRPIDMEGLPAARSQPVENGRISLFMTDLAAARQLGIAPSGHAGRGPGDIPAPTAANLYLTAGDPSPEDLISDIHTGLYVTELSGQGVNTITGDYSRGAAGFMIQNGIITDPVEGATVAGNLKEMFAGLSRADDLNFHYGIDAPTVRIAEMTVAGR